MEAQKSLTYHKTQENVAPVALEFQRHMRLIKLLELKENESLATEMKDAGKFNKVVVRDEKGYYLLQSRRKDKAEVKISWDSLFPKNSNEKMFNLWDYFESFLKIRQQKRFHNKMPSEFLVKELTLATNLNFKDNIITEYLESDMSSTWRALHMSEEKVKRYRITQDREARNPIIKEIKSNKNFENETEITINQFLDLLAFEVELPDIEEQREIVKSKLVSLLPFELNGDEAKQASDIFEDKLNQHLVGMPEQATGVVLHDRQKLLRDIILAMKEKLQLGSTRGYKSTLWKPFYEDCEVNFSSKQKKKFEDGLSKGGVNILVAPDKSFPILATCKVMSHFERIAAKTDLNKRSIYWLVAINSEEDGKQVAQTFKDKRADLCNDFIFVIEFSRNLCLENKTPELVKSMCSSKYVGRFVFITSKPVIGLHSKISSLINDELSLECFPVNRQADLTNKKLNVKNGRTTSLREMGIDLNKLGSLSLAELVLYDNETDQIDLHLPVVDKSFERIYVPRQIKIPVVSERNLSALFHGQNEKGKDLALFQIPNVSSLDISHPKSKQLYLLKRDAFSLDGMATKLNDMTETITVKEDLLIDRNSNLLHESASGVKTAFVIDSPGMGKSTLLTRLGNILLKEFCNSATGNDRIVVRINLGTYHPDTWKKPMTSTTDIISFFQSKQAPGTVPALNKTLFEGILLGHSSWKAVLFLDGFDEIGDEGRAFVEKLVSLLLNSSQMGSEADATLNGIERILMASRPDRFAHQKLELFNQYAFRLLELDLSNQEKLMVSFWSERLEQDSDFDSVISAEVTEQCKKFAGVLINQVKEQVKDNEGLVLAIPLQCMLLAESFYNEMKKYVESKEQAEPTNKLIDDNFSILTLFDMFLDRKFEIGYREKRQQPIDTNIATLNAYKREKSRFLDRLQRLSVFNMVENKNNAEIISGNKLRQLKKELRDAKNFGLITFDSTEMENSTKDIIPRFSFIHRTFAEYFMAQQMYVVFDEGNELFKEVQPCKIIDEIVVTSKEFEGVRRFFMQFTKSFIEEFVRKGCPVSMVNDPALVIEKWPGLGKLQSFSKQYFTYLLKVFQKF